MRPMDVAGGPTSYMATLLTDAAPVLYGKTLAHFYVGVREVDAIASGQTVVLGSSSTPSIVDLLQYQNGSAAWMTQTVVPAKSYSELRYVLDMNSTKAVFSDGSSVPVAYSGGYTYSSGGMGASTSTAMDPTIANAIDVTIDSPLVIGTGVAAVMGDFNLTESLAATRSGIVMRPTLSVANAPASISGTVLNYYGQGVRQATILAVGSSGYAVNSATTDASGSFAIHALPADTYQLIVYNAYTNAAGERIYASNQTYGAGGFYGPSLWVGAGKSASAGTIGD